MPPEVVVAAVEQRDVPEVQEWVGVLDGSVNAQIQAQVRGYLLRQLYRDGTFVKKGQGLFEIDPRPFEAVLAQARSDVARAEAEQVRTEANLRRAQELIKKDAISQMEVDTAVEQAAAAKANLQAALANLEAAKINLGFTEIVSPIEGIAGQALAQVGDLVGGGDGKLLTTVSTIDPIRALFNVSEQEYLKAAEDIAAAVRNPNPGERKATLELVLADGSVYPHRGTFDFVDRQIDPATGTLRAAALFPNPEGILRPGSFAKVRAAVDVVEGGLLVPQEAVRELQGGTQVIVVDGSDQAEIRQVTTGFRVGRLWLIREGLNPGERVVVEGLQRITRNGPVRVRGERSEATKSLEKAGE
ncbi:MAG: efflux RND transporter periplasmic adaptor subunit [Verrucomicrobiia bacterium]